MTQERINYIFITLQTTTDIYQKVENLKFISRKQKTIDHFGINH